MAQYNDPMNILDRFKHKDNVKNYANWENQTFIELLNASGLAATREERFQLLEEAEAIMMDEMPVAPIFHWNAAYIAKPYVKSYGQVNIGNGFFDRVYIDINEKQAAIR